jgi:hypothetical protein
VSQSERQFLLEFHSIVAGWIFKKKKMKILPASNAGGASSSSSSTSSQVSGLKLGIVRLGRAAGKVIIIFFLTQTHSKKSPIFILI